MSNTRWNQNTLDVDYRQDLISALRMSPIPHDFAYPRDPHVLRDVVDAEFISFLANEARPGAKIVIILRAIPFIRD